MGAIESVVGDKKFFGLELRKKGNVDVQRLHKLAGWFSANKYDFMEKGLSSKTKPEGKQQIIEWAGERKADSYFKLHIDVDMRIWRYKGEKAEIYVRFKGYLEKDYKDTFKKKAGKFGESLRNVYERYVIKERVDKMKDMVYYDTNALADEAKRVLNLAVK